MDIKILNCDLGNSTRIDESSYHIILRQVLGNKLPDEATCAQDNDLKLLVSHCAQTLLKYELYLINMEHAFVD